MSTENEDLALMMDEAAWPQWPLLPVVHRTRTFADQDRCGVLVAGQEIARVYFVNLWDSAAIRKINEARFEEYDHLDALVREWRVD